MISPTSQDLLTSVIVTVEDEIAPIVDDEYVASLCRTVAQLLRQVQVRIESEPAALAADNAELRALLESLQTDGRLAGLLQDLPSPVEPTMGPLDGLTAEANHLRHRLVEVIGAVPDSSDPVRLRCRDYLANQVRRQLPWQQDAYTGPRR